MKRLIKAVFLMSVLCLIATNSFGFVAGDIDFMKMDRPKNAIISKSPHQGTQIKVIKYFGAEDIELVWVKIQYNSFSRRWAVMEVVYFKEDKLQIYHNDGNGNWTQKFDILEKTENEMIKDLQEAKEIEKKPTEQGDNGEDK